MLINFRRTVLLFCSIGNSSTPLTDREVRRWIAYDQKHRHLLRRNRQPIRIRKFQCRKALLDPPAQDKQIAYYHPGVGTMGARNALSVLGKWWTKIRGLAFGYGFSDNIADVYSFLMAEFNPGDNVFIFGFSRGSYTARALCGLIRMCGLLTPGNEALIPYALRLYKSNDPCKFEIAAGFRKPSVFPVCPIFSDCGTPSARSAGFSIPFIPRVAICPIPRPYLAFLSATRGIDRRASRVFPPEPHP